GVLVFCTSEKCLLSPSSGTCDTSSANRTGCGGNANNFETREECLSEYGQTGPGNVLYAHNYNPTY
ncbi:unnamed protein product, partial [Allacma fusca]